MVGYPLMMEGFKSLGVKASNETDTGQVSLCPYRPIPISKFIHMFMPAISIHTGCLRLISIFIPTELWVSASLI